MGSQPRVTCFWSRKWDASDISWIKLTCDPLPPIKIVSPDLVYKLLHTGLQAPDFKFDSDQFVGAHDGVLGVDPSLLQKPPARLLRLKIPKVLQGHEIPSSEKLLFFLRI